MSRPVLVARCENEIEQPDLSAVRCYGELRFAWGAQQAACDTCGAWCGIAVAQWERVAQWEHASAKSGPDPEALAIENAELREYVSLQACGCLAPALDGHPCGRCELLGEHYMEPDVARRGLVERGDR